MFDLCTCPVTLNKRLDRETVLSHCVSKLDCFDIDAAIQYGQQKNYINLEGELTASGQAFATFLKTYGEMELNELQSFRDQGRIAVSYIAA